ncbi:MAG: AAA family ATPase [Candidatus Thorarchaeota archaeon]|nr:AAA family ATPase [Candidatus Thorarchaeota archaeon]
MTRRKESGMDLPASSRDSTKKASKHKHHEVRSAELVVLEPVGYPFRLRGDPKPVGLEIDNQELFTDYAREQWMGSVLYSGMYLFDRYVMPDFAFRVAEVTPEDSVVTRTTTIQLKSAVAPKPPIPSRYTLNDIVGHEQVKRKCMLILKYLKDPARFGEWSPRAVLFHGPPGTGKTMTARALAQEANAQIFLVKASDLIGIHVGDGGRRISTLFNEAREESPSIVFVDELDAIGLARSFQSIRGDVSEVVTALLGELDSTDESSGVVVIGATNALPLLDRALRSRFDAVFEFNLPDVKERLLLLKMYASRLPIPLEADLAQLAARTEGFSGRDLRDRLLKESFHIALISDMDVIPSHIVNAVLEKIRSKESPDYMV